jgi:hypothetical protein
MKRRTFLGAFCTTLCSPRLYTSAAYPTLRELGANAEGTRDDFPVVLLAYALLQQGTRVIVTRGVYRLGNGWTVQHASTCLSTTSELVAWAGVGELRV